MSMPGHAYYDSRLSPERRAEVRTVAEQALVAIPGTTVSEHVSVIRGYLVLLDGSPNKAEFLGNVRKSLSVLANLAEAHGHAELTHRLDSLIRSLQ
jgi:predicted kinase